MASVASNSAIEQIITLGASNGTVAGYPLTNKPVVIAVPPNGAIAEYKLPNKPVPIGVPPNGTVFSILNKIKKTLFSVHNSKTNCKRVHRNV